MYERFTDRARKAVQSANQVARVANFSEVGADCLLAGVLMDDGTSIASMALHAAGVVPHILLAEVRSSWGEQPSSVSRGRVPLSQEAKKIIEASMSAARDLGHSYVGTEHLVLGMLRDEQNAASVLLRGAGLTLDRFLAAATSVIPEFVARQNAADAQVVPQLAAAISTDAVVTGESPYAKLLTQDCTGKWVMRVPGAGYLHSEDLVAIVAELAAKNTPAEQLHA